MHIRFLPIPTQMAQAWRNGAADAYGLAPEHRAASTLSATLCRHCLHQVPEGKPYLIVAHRPFGGLNPYTETGPVFICAEECEAGGSEFPTSYLQSAQYQYIVRGYSADERIIYGTGAVVPTKEIEARCRELFTQTDVAFIHIRSASNNCFQCRIERA